MARVIITNPPPFKRYFHNCANGTTARVCRRCGAHVYGPNRGICGKCLKETGAKHGKQ